MVSFQEMIKQRELAQISCKAELDKKSVSILIYKLSVSVMQAGM